MGRLDARRLNGVEEAFRRQLGRSGVDKALRSVANSCAHRSDWNPPDAPAYGIFPDSSAP